MLYVVAEDDIPGLSDNDPSHYLLQPGSTYLLATRYNPTQNWYTLNSFPTASKLISDDSSLSNNSLKVLAANDVRVQQLQAAYPNEILLPADVAHNNTLNSYQSLHPAPVVVPTSTPTVEAVVATTVSSTSSATSSMEMSSTTTGGM